MRSIRQYSAAVRNLKHARAAKKKMRLAEEHIGRKILTNRLAKRGGFLPANASLAALIPGPLAAVHSALQTIKPVSFAKNVGQSMGFSLPKGRFGDLARKVGSFAINTLGYGGALKLVRRKRRAHRGRPRKRVLMLRHL